MKRIIRMLVLLVIVCLYIPCTASAGDTGKPIIGISADITKDIVWPDYSYCNLSECYIDAVIKAGGIPLVIPVNDNEEVIAAQVKLLDGLIMSGGDDINPLLYKEEPNANLKATQPRRDTFEKVLLKNAFDKKIPVLGTCRGQQFINVYNGGTLYQDIPTMAPNCTIKHSQETDWKTGTHTVEIKKGSWISKVLGVDETVVNSFHHQAVKNVAPGFRITALSKDGIIEGIEKEHGSFCVAVQWHPEMMQVTSPLMLKIFRAFVQECEKSESK